MPFEAAAQERDECLRILREKRGSYDPYPIWLDQGHHNPHIDSGAAAQDRSEGATK